jgi:hypothetical protein
MGQTFLSGVSMEKFVPILALTSVLILSACATHRVVTFPEPVEKPQAQPTPAPSMEEVVVENIDYNGLENFLKMQKPVEKLGYSEKSFATCEVGYGYSSNSHCRREIFVSVHFQLFCRENEEESYTQALTVTDMHPLKDVTAKWTLDNKHGEINLDDQGYGQIKTVVHTSPRSRRLKIAVGNENLYIKSGEISKVVTPSNWCH